MDRKEAESIWIERINKYTGKPDFINMMKPNSCQMQYIQMLAMGLQDMLDSQSQHRSVSNLDQYTFNFDYCLCFPKPNK